jgi:hypothetical protein
MKLKYHFSLLIIVMAIFSMSITATAQTPSKNVVIAAQKMGAHLIAKDYGKFLDYTHPKILTMTGGKSKMLTILNETFKTLTDNNIWFDEIIVSEPKEIFKVGSELQTTLLQKTIFDAPKGDFFVESTLIAISKDKGLTWVFIDCSKTTLANLKQIIPSLSSKLVIVPATKPTKI